MQLGRGVPVGAFAIVLPCLLGASLAPGPPHRFHVDETTQWEVELDADQLVVVHVAADQPLELFVQPPDVVAVSHSLTAGSTSTQVRFVSDEPGTWLLRVEVEQPTTLTLQLDRAPATGTDRLRWQSELGFAEVLHAIEADQVAAALRAGQRAVRARAAAEPDSLALASFNEDIGVQFALAASDSLRALGEQFLLRALRLRKEVEGDRSFLVADTQTTLSSYYYMIGDFATATKLQEQSLTTLESLPDVADSTLAYARNDLGLTYYQMGRYDDARISFEGALGLYERAGVGRFPIADIHNSLGEIHRLTGDVEASRSAFERAEAEATDLIEQTVDTQERDEIERFRAVVWLNQAGLLYDDSRYDDAEVLYRRAADVWMEKGSKDPINLPHALMNLADICRIEGRYGEALDLFVQSFQTAQRDLGPHHPDTSWSQNYLAQLLVEMGRYDAAEKNYRECIQRLEDAGDAGAARLGTPLRGMGDLYAARGDQQTAAEYYRRSAERFVATQGDLSVDAARSSVAQARAVFRSGSPDAVPRARTLLEAVGLALEANPLFPELQIAAHTLEAELLDAEGWRGKAVEVLDATLSQAESIRRTSSLDDRGRASFFADYADAYRKLARWSMQEGNLAGAVDATERFRSRVLLDQMRAAQVDLRSGVPPQILGQLDDRRHEASRELAEVERDMRQAQESGSASKPEFTRRRNEAMRELRLVQTDLRRASPVWRKAAEDEDHLVTVDAIHELLRPGEVMLLYQIGRESSLVLTIASDGSLDGELLQVDADQAATLGIEPGALTIDCLRRILTPGPGPGVAGARGSLLQPLTPAGSAGILDALQRPPSADARVPTDELHALYQVLIPRALRDAWHHMDAVVIVPDGLLFQLPFEALVVDEQEHYWLQDGPVVRYAPSATVLWLQERRRRARTGTGWSTQLVTVSDPDFGFDAQVATVAQARAERGGALQPLPGTAVEAHAIVSHFDPGGVIELRGADATEARVREVVAGARYLHFATHGLVHNRRDDVFAALALTPGAIARSATSDDGFLELAEIYDLQLHAELAVLSACTTNVGDWIEGDGVFALSRGFLAAGCDRVVGSLWLVDDASTAALMGEFFARLTRTSSPDPARALRDARLAVLDDASWSHPFYWAPFVMIGLR